MTDVFRLDAAMVAKLASIVVHADELFSPDGHRFDKAALVALINDPDVMDWVDAAQDQSLAPRKRKTF